MNTKLFLSGKHLFQKPAHPLLAADPNLNVKKLPFKRGRNITRIRMKRRALSMKARSALSVFELVMTCVFFVEQVRVTLLRSVHRADRQ